MRLYAAERGGRPTRFRGKLHLRPRNAHDAILESLEGTRKYAVYQFGGVDAGRQRGDDAPAASIPA